MLRVERMISVQEFILGSRFLRRVFLSQQVVMPVSFIRPLRHAVRLHFRKQGAEFRSHGVWFRTGYNGAPRVQNILYRFVGLNFQFRWHASILLSPSDPLSLVCRVRHPGLLMEGLVRTPRKFAVSHREDIIPACDNLCGM
jgi:hypothetical protein